MAVKLYFSARKGRQCLRVNGHIDEICSATSAGGWIGSQTSPSFLDASTRARIYQEQGKQRVAGAWGGSGFGTSSCRVPRKFIRSQHKLTLMNESPGDGSVHFIGLGAWLRGHLASRVGLRPTHQSEGDFVEDPALTLNPYVLDPLCAEGPLPLPDAHSDVPEQTMPVEGDSCPMLPG